MFGWLLNFFYIIYVYTVHSQMYYIYNIKFDGNIFLKKLKKINLKQKFYLEARTCTYPVMRCTMYRLWY
jgi:hypothetical protein